MRRYAVRFLVAILTFAIGLTLSLVLGLFKPAQIKVAQMWDRKPPCPKKFRVSRPAFLTLDTESSDPLKLVYLGENADRGMEFRVENRRDQTISGYTIKAIQVWADGGPVDRTNFDLHSDVPLLPGESFTITTIPRSDDALSIRISSVTFESGFTWINPRETR